MMIKALCSFMFLNHDKCKADLHKFIEDGDKKVKSLEFEITTLLTQIQELKAINHYQAYDLERKINELEKQVEEYKKEKNG